MSAAPKPMPANDSVRAMDPRTVQLSDSAILRRLAQDYLGRRRGVLATAILFMLVAAAMNGIMAWLLGPTIKDIFLQKNAHMLVVLPLVIVVVVAIRAAASFGQETVLTGLAEK